MNISSLAPNQKNPRKISPEALEGLRASLEKFGDLSGVVFNRSTGQLVGGHQRVKIFTEENPEITMVEDNLGFFIFSGHKFPYREVEWTPAFEAQANLAANNPAIQGEFDLDRLPEILELAKEEDSTGLMLDSIAGLLLQPDIKKDIEEDEPPLPPIEPKTKHGDLYEFGNHRLLCGDSTNPDDLKILMGEIKADLIHTDPPYMVDYHSQSGHGYSDGKYESKAIFNDNLSDEQAIEFYKKVAKNLHDFSTENATFYWWFAMNKSDLNTFALKSENWKISQTIIWVKEHFIFSMGQLYHRIYEPCIVGWKKGGKHFQNPKINNLTDLFSLDFEDYNKLFDLWYQKRDNTNNYLHPTQKPVNLPGRAIQRSSQPGAVVLDLFGGSGSTMMACEQLGRKSYNMELDPKFCDVIVKRWINWKNSQDEKVEILLNGEKLDSNKFIE